MAIAFPYTRYACPCGDLTADPLSLEQLSLLSNRENEAFNPHHPHANCSLYPLEQLLYCDECNATQCSRCWSEEVMCWYCPNCMFEVPSSGVKGDGNRCTRQCYDCPLCQANLAVTAIARKAGEHLKPEVGSGHEDSYFLHCQYCDWSTLEIGVKFSKPTKVTEQLNRQWKMRIASSSTDEGDDQKQNQEAALHHDTAFARLSKFYKEQLTESSDQSGLYSNSPYNSPANLARIMSLYGGLSYNALKKTREKPQPMREAGNRVEGLCTFTAETNEVEDELVQKMRKSGFEGTTSQQQRFASPYNFHARLDEDLWPVASKLRARRGKRCRTCRQFLVRPETKPDRIKYKIRLLALQHVPRLSTRPLHQAGPLPNASFQLRPEPLQETILPPYQTQQYILTVRNPIFEKVKISLATPATTPGKIASKVTILCPSFSVGPAGDVWDEALSNSTISDGSRQAAMASLTGDSDRQPEAGKVWERSRNSTSVILEIIPGGTKRRPSIVADQDQDSDMELGEDEDILEIPIHVRANWWADQSVHEISHHGEEKPKSVERVNKELSYWVVLGIARIAEG